MAEVKDWTTYLSEEEKGRLHRADSYTPSYFAQKVAALRALVEEKNKALQLWQEAVSIRFEGEREDWLESESMNAYMLRNQAADDAARAALGPALALTETALLERLEEKP